MKPSLMLLGAFGVALATQSALAADAPPPPPAPHHYFDSMDTSHDGTVSKDEWRARGDAMFAEIDTNHDGKLSPEEMKAHFEAKRAKEEAWRAAHPKPDAAPAKAK